MRNRGPVVTYGVNDMVLDNWGNVDRWIVEQKLTSYGPSGIGFVNFNHRRRLRQDLTRHVIRSTSTTGNTSRDGLAASM